MTPIRLTVLSPEIGATSSKDCGLPLTAGVGGGRRQDRPQTTVATATTAATGAPRASGLNSGLIHHRSDSFTSVDLPSTILAATERERVERPVSELESV
jgi:hypothetical protein